MNNKLSVLLSRKLIISGIIQKEFEAIYIYGFELLLSFVVSVSIILALSILIRKFFESLIFLVLFIAIRQFTGGFHARTYLKCQIFTMDICTMQPETQAITFSIR